MNIHIAVGVALVVVRAQFALAQIPDSKNPLNQLSGSIRELTNRVSPAVVEILVAGYTALDDGKSQTVTRISRQDSSGSGVIVDPAGDIMTSAHVVQGAIRIRVLIPAAAASRA